VAVIDHIRRLERGLRLIARDVEASTGASAAQLFALEQLAAGGPLALQELAARTLTDRSSVSVVVDRLVSAGLAARSTSRVDRRRAEVRITAAGRRALAAAPTPPTQRLLAAVGTLSPSARRALGAGLGRLNAALGFDEPRPSMLFEEPAAR
jgi:DNA-binding MarR family transcriptional regulator